MMRIEDVVIKTIVSAEVPVATACKMFMPFRGNCFGRFHYVSKSFLIYMKNSFVNTCGGTMIINTKHFFSNQFQKKQIIANIVLCEPLLF